MKTVQDIFKEARAKSGKSTRQVASEVGFSAMSISYAERPSTRSSSNLSERVVRTLAGYYGLNAETLVEQYTKEKQLAKGLKEKNTRKAVKK